MPPLPTPTRRPIPGGRPIRPSVMDEKSTSVQTIASEIGGGTLAVIAGSVLIAIGICETIISVGVAAGALEMVMRPVAYVVVALLLAAVGYVLLNQGVHSAQEEVEETVETVEEKVEHALDIEHQVQKRPLIAVGSAVVAGLILAKILPLPIPFLTTSSDPPPRRRASRRRDEDEGGSLLGSLATMAGSFAARQALSLGMGVAQTALTTMFVKQAAEKGADQAAASQMQRRPPGPPPGERGPFPRAPR